MYCEECEIEDFVNVELEETEDWDEIEERQDVAAGEVKGKGNWRKT